MLADLRSRPEISPTAGAAVRLPGQLRSPGALPYRLRLPLPLHPQTIPPLCSHCSAGLGKAHVSRWSLRAAARRGHGRRTLPLRAGVVTVLGQAPLEEGSAGERFPVTENRERPLNPSSALPRTGWCQLSAGLTAAAAHLGLPAAKKQSEVMSRGERGGDKRKRIWVLGMSELLWAVLSITSHSYQLLCLIINACR